MTPDDKLKDDTPDDRVKDDTPIDESPAKQTTDWVAVGASVVFLGLVVIAVLMVRTLVNSEQVEAMKTAPLVPSTTRILSSKDLETFTRLTNEDLIVLPGKDDPTGDKKLAALRDRYLLTNVTSGTEIKSDMLVPTEPKGLLDNSIAVSIPATATSTLGGQLRVGDVIDLLLIPGNQSAKPEPFENLLVLNISLKKVDDKSPAEPAAITLALPTDKRDKFVPALPNAAIVITRKISVK